MLTPSHASRTRKSAGEALTGARAGQVLSRERKIDFGGPTSSYNRKATRCRSLSRERFRPRVV